jgi:hypothetical protein
MSLGSLEVSWRDVKLLGHYEVSIWFINSIKTDRDKKSQMKFKIEFVFFMFWFKLAAISKRFELQDWNLYMKIFQTRWFNQNICTFISLWVQFHSSLRKLSLSIDPISHDLINGFVLICASPVWWCLPRCQSTLLPRLPITDSDPGPGEFHDQGDNVEKEYYQSIVT